MDNNNNIYNNGQNYQPQPQAQDPGQYQYQPQYQQPQYQQPYQQPQYQQPVYQQPPYQQAPYQQAPYQQPVYQQPYNPQYIDPALQAAPQKPVRPIDLLPAEERAARKKKATILCVISLILQFAPYVLMGIFESILDTSATTTASNISSASVGAQILLYAMGGTYVASWVLMIIARAKYSESVFAKVLMWVYLGILSIGVIGTILLIAMCAAIVRSC